MVSVVSLILSSCGEGNGKPLSDYKDATTGDSLMYYFAQMCGYGYYKKARVDTILKNPKQRKLFLDGVRDGIKAIRDDEGNTAYNMGLRHGARMMMKCIELEQECGINLDENILMESLRYALADPSREIPIVEVQNEYYHLLDRFKKTHENNDVKKTRQTLKEIAKNKKMTELRPDLYYRLDRMGDGSLITIDDSIDVSIDYETSTGYDLGLPATERIVVGSPGIPTVLNISYLHLNKGALGVFLTTADALFGSRASIMGLQPDEVMLVKISVNEVKKNLKLPEDQPVPQK